MWYGKQASPASSTSTVDQQEIIFDDNQLITQHQQQQLYQVQSTSSIHQQINNQYGPTTQQHQLHQYQHQQSTSHAANSNPSTTATTIGRRQTTTRGTKRPRNALNHCTKVNGINKTPNTTTGTSSANTIGLSISNTGNNHSNRHPPPKRPKLFDLPQQPAPWKSLQHHFQKHTDVKLRPEKRSTMAELGNEVMKRRNGWKVHHLVGQLTDLMQNEMQNREKLKFLIELFHRSGSERIHNLAGNCHKLPEQYATLLQSQRSYGTNEFKPELIFSKMDDLLKGDLQRSNLFDDQLRDCRDLIVRITDEHRDRVARITTKFNKRIQL